MSHRRGFIECSLGGTLAFFRQALYDDESASLPGLLQGLDPRVKAASLLAFLLLALFTRSLPMLGVQYLLCLTLAALSRVPLGSFLFRTWVFIYLFVGIVEDTYRAIKSRVGSGMHYRKGQRIVTWNMAHLWKRSYQLNEQV